MSDDIIHIDAGEEKLVEHSRAEVFSFKVLLHARETSDEAVEESVLEWVTPDVLSQYAQHPHQPCLVLCLGCLKCILHCQRCSYWRL